MISDWTEVAETFDSMGLHENLLRGIYAYGVPRGRQLPRCFAASGSLGVAHLCNKTHRTLFTTCQVSRSRLRSSRGVSCRSAAATT